MKRDRRQFIRGQWIAHAAAQPGPSGTAEIASILVQARPERLDAAAAAIERIGGAEIYQRDPRGKLVVVLEATDDSDPIGEMLTRISLLDDVITATLVYHTTDVGPEPQEDVAS
jgi:nitrate reductase NapD